MSLPVDLGAVLTVAGTALVGGAGVNSSAFSPGRMKRVRFYVRNVRSAGSGATTTTIKLQMRYNNGSVQTGYVDLPSIKEDASATREVSHAFTSTANATTDGSFFLDDASAIADMIVNVIVNSTGQAGDTTTIYAVAA